MTTSTTAALIKAARDVCASASYMKQMTERGEVYGSPDMAVPIASMESLRQAIAAIEQQPAGGDETSQTVSVTMFGSAELTDELRAVAAAIHYPDCWDTAAYPTLASAALEIGCNECDCTKHPLTKNKVL